MMLCSNSPWLRTPMVGSQIIEKQALKALPLESKRCLLPKQRLPIIGVLAHASVALRTHFRSLLRIQTPRRRKEVEGGGTVRADDRVVWRGQSVHSTSLCHRCERLRESVLLAHTCFASTRRNR